MRDGTLELGESVTFSVSARKRWNPSGVRLKAGQKYCFSVENAIWTDAWIQTTPDGYEQPLFRPFEQARRVPDAKWFALCGCIGRDLRAAFTIGRGLAIFAPPLDGEPVCVRE
jgi:hypothetical protein